MRNSKFVTYSIATIIILVIVGIIYSTFFKPSNGMPNTTSLLMVALLIGLILGLLIFKVFQSKSNDVKIIESSHTVVESIKKVFKIVTAEGQFNEIYSYEESSKVFGFIPTQKKALVIVTAKALIGYDIEKCKWEVNEENKSIKLIHFPTPEILSIDTDYKYYNIEENLLNKFSREDLAKIQQNGKKQVIQAAENSNLPKIAAEQMKLLLSEVLYSKDWKIENIHLISVKSINHSQSTISTNN